jgi:hypothetical protein
MQSQQENNTDNTIVTSDISKSVREGLEPSGESGLQMDVHGVKIQRSELFNGSLEIRKLFSLSIALPND